MMPLDTLLILRQVNHRVRSALASFRPEQKLCSTIMPADLSGLLAELLRGGECLRRLDADLSSLVPGCSEEAAALATETHLYRTNLEELRRLLPDFYGRLLAERSRLQDAQTHVAAVAAWVQASDKTL